VVFHKDAALADPVDDCQELPEPLFNSTRVDDSLIDVITERILKKMNIDSAPVVNPHNPSFVGDPKATSSDQPVTRYGRVVKPVKRY